MTTDTRDREGVFGSSSFFSLDRCEAPGAGAFETNITQERVRKVDETERGGSDKGIADSGCGASDLSE